MQETCTFADLLVQIRNYYLSFDYSDVTVQLLSTITLTFLLFIAFAREQMHYVSIITAAVLVILTVDKYKLFYLKLTHERQIILDANRMNELCCVKLPLVLIVLFSLFKFLQFVRKNIKTMNKRMEIAEQVIEMTK
ncbi:Hypothetical_protein [Hexamita inflata]|uniref:Hypothetical_protein n=1 Tax=Hexamita inflata TaxID=28002 RepID=A0ABP1H6U7_9EUKA